MSDVAAASWLTGNSTGTDTPYQGILSSTMVLSQETVTTLLESFFMFGPLCWQLGTVKREKNKKKNLNLIFTSC